MEKVSTRPQVGATHERSPSLIRPAAHSREIVAFDPSFYDALSMRATEIEGLASCLICLTAVERTNEGNFDGYELIGDALPLLGGVIMRLARETREAGDELFAQYKEARDAASEVQA